MMSFFVCEFEPLLVSRALELALQAMLFATFYRFCLPEQPSLQPWCVGAVVDAADLGEATPPV
jgi:hypothetical protein